MEILNSDVARQRIGGGAGERERERQAERQRDKDHKHIFGVMVTDRDLERLVSLSKTVAIHA